jgi:hypothetical protein
MDGHSSHESVWLKRTAYGVTDCTVIILCFPSKCTHKMQPLDVVVFNPVQREWKSHCDRLATKGWRLNRYTVIPEYMKVRKKKVTAEVIKNAFSATGIYPINWEVFSAEDFAPSETTSGRALVGPSYPAEVPSSDPAIPTDIEDSDYEDDYISDYGNMVIDLDDDSNDESGSSDDDRNLTPTPPTRRSSSKILTLRNALLLKKIVTPSEDEKKTHQELLEEVQGLRSQLHSCSSTIEFLYAQLSAAEAHATLAKRGWDEAAERYENSVKKKQRVGKMKANARYVAHPDLENHWKQMEIQMAKDHEEEQHRQQEKSDQAAAREARLAERASQETFTRPLQWFRSSALKEDLQVLARALQLSDAGTKEEIFTRIKGRLDGAPNLADNARFCALFQSGATRRNATASSGISSNSQPEVASASLPEQSVSSGRTYDPAPYLLLANHASSSTAALEHHPVSATSSSLIMPFF